MHPSIEQLLAKRLPLKGVAGAAVRIHDETFLYPGHAVWLTRIKARSALDLMVAAVQNSLASRQRATQLRWDFERMILVFSIHSSGAGLALFIPKDPTLAFGEINSLLEDFQRLELTR